MGKTLNINELIRKTRKKIAPSEKIFKDKKKYQRKRKHIKKESIDF